MWSAGVSEPSIGVGLFTPDNTWSTLPLSCIDQCPCQAKLWLLASLHTTLHSVVALWCVLMIRTHWRCGKRKRGSGVTETPLQSVLNSLKASHIFLPINFLFSIPQRIQRILVSSF